MNSIVLKQQKKSMETEMTVTIYRIMQHSMFDVLWKQYGLEKAYECFRGAGRLAGLEYAKSMLKLDLSFRAFIAELQEALSELDIGVLRIESFDTNTYDIVLSVSQVIDSSGTPVTNGNVSVYDEGFISGILEAFTGVRYNVREEDYRSREGRICRFSCEADIPKL